MDITPQNVIHPRWPCFFTRQTGKGRGKDWKLSGSSSNPFPLLKRIFLESVRRLPICPVGCTTIKIHRKDQYAGFTTKQRCSYPQVGGGMALPPAEAMQCGAALAITDIGDMNMRTTGKQRC